MTCLHYINYLDMLIYMTRINLLIKLKKNNKTIIPELFSCLNSVCEYVLISNNSIFTEASARTYLFKKVFNRKLARKYYIFSIADTHG